MLARYEARAGEAACGGAARLGAATWGAKRREGVWRAGGARLARVAEPEGGAWRRRACAVVLLGALALAAAAPVFSETPETEALLASLLEIEQAPAGKGRSRVTCDLTAESGICLYGGQKLLLPDAVPKGLVGFWTFDEVYPVDSSRNQNNLEGVMPLGPGRSGRGASAHFEGENFFSVPSSPSLAQTATRFTVSFWINFFPDSGTENVDSNIAVIGSQQGVQFQLAHNGESNRIMAAGRGGRLKVGSNAVLSRGSWHHVAVVLGERHFSLYINGVLDARQTFEPEKEIVPFPSYAVQFGRVPFLASNLAYTQFLLDDLKIFSRAVTQFEVAAESFGALGAVEPDYIRFGCRDCGYEPALAACKAVQGYELCSELQLYSGGLQAAYRMGYAGGKQPVWHSVGTVHKFPESEKRVGICCAQA
jgi:hypothetical protein